MAIRENIQNKSAIRQSPPPDGAVQLSLFGGTADGEFTLQQVIDALRLCLRGKSGTMDAQEFVNAFYPGCVALWRELNSRQYRPSRYIVFISPHPVTREIFASMFRDRGVDTLIIQRLLPLLEQHLVDDNYSTRVAKGTLYGVKRIYNMIWQESEGYTRDCYVLQLDIWSFFMSIPKDKAWQVWADFLNRYYMAPDRELILWTLRVILNDRPEQHCVRKGSVSDWNPLPRHKSLFYGDGRHGLPIGKVVVQMTALLYLHDLDMLLLTDWKTPHNGHYMDDRTCVHTSERHLLAVKSKIDHWHEGRELMTHPRKTKLLHYRQGIKFAGAMILPGRTYLLNSTVCKCFSRLYYYNEQAKADRSYVYQHIDDFAATMNSYFGQLCQHTEWNLTHRIIHMIGPEWYQVMEVVRRSGQHNYIVRPKSKYQLCSKAMRMLYIRMNHYKIVKRTKGICGYDRIKDMRQTA